MCSCGRGEADGLMIQCEVCLTWQHGICLAIFTDDQVSIQRLPPYIEYVRIRPLGQVLTDADRDDFKPMDPFFLELVGFVNEN